MKELKEVEIVNYLDPSWVERFGSTRLKLALELDYTPKRGYAMERLLWEIQQKFPYPSMTVHSFLIEEHDTEVIGYPLLKELKVEKIIKSIPNVEETVWITDQQSACCVKDRERYLEVVFLGQVFHLQFEYKSNFKEV